MEQSIDRFGNRVVVRGEVHPVGLRMLCAMVYQVVFDSGYSDVVLDFSMCNGVAESTMLPLMPIVAEHRRTGVEFDLVLPAHGDLERLFHNTNWAHHICPAKYLPTTHEGGHVPALRFGEKGPEYEDELELNERVIDMILRALETDRGTLKAVEWSLGEIMDNVSSHAKSSVGGFVQATAFKQQNRVEFVVADAGIGISESMGTSDPEQAMREAISEGVTSDATMNAGNGLYGSYRVAALSGGIFEINSMYGHLYCREDITARRMRIPYSGTAVRCRINIGDSALLENALRFKGRPHDPPFDYIEKKFETEEGELIFNLKSEARRDFGSRSGGIRVRGVIENLMRDRRMIVIDFDGVGVFTSSFADEVFGRLFVKLGPRSFMSRIQMRNVDPTVEGLIDRAILQRTRLGNGESTPNDATVAAMEAAQRGEFAGTGSFDDMMADLNADD